MYRRQPRFWCVRKCKILDAGALWNIPVALAVCLNVYYDCLKSIVLRNRGTGTNAALQEQVQSNEIAESQCALTEVMPSSWRVLVTYLISKENFMMVLSHSPCVFSGNSASILRTECGSWLSLISVNQESNKNFKSPTCFLGRTSDEVCEGALLFSRNLHTMFCNSALTLLVHSCGCYSSLPLLD